MSRIFVGVDTSNYTTSLAAVDEEGNILLNLKRLLPVKDGACGLRQSDALFHHTAALPALIEELRPLMQSHTVVAVGVSTRPRNVEGSYMPCFLAGVSVATALATAISVPLYRFSHQCGHLMAAIRSSGKQELLSAPFGAFHVSGGTTELLRVSYEKGGFIADLVGGTRDLNAGQAIDRIGVAMGLSFPAGPAMEALAAENTAKVPRRKLSTDGTYVHLSGLENMAEKLYKETENKPLVAAYTLDFVAESLAAMANAYLTAHPGETLLFAGGVMSNRRIRTYLADRFSSAFGAPILSSDNAVGIAYLARRKQKNK